MCTGWIANQAVLTLICVLDLSLRTIRPGSNNDYSTSLTVNENSMQINLESLAKNNNGKEKAYNKKDECN